MKNIFILIGLMLIGFAGQSQLDNSLLFNADVDSLIFKNKNIGFHVDNVNYIRNTEFHSDIEQGATWVGTQIWPTVNYRYNKFISFKLGVLLQKDFGNNKFRSPIPTYTLTYKNKNIKANFGTLDGSLDHQLIEPLYGTENFIDNRIENGYQIKGVFKKWTYDQWLNWEKMIYRTSTTQEKFSLGFSGQYHLINLPALKFGFPIQITGRHIGGEIYAQPHGTIKTQFNFAYGTQLTRLRPGKKIDKIDFQGYLTFYEDLSPTKADSFRDGTGQYFALTLKMKNFGLMMNYWDAHQFISPLGEPYYVSSSREYIGSYRQYRKMVMFRILYEKKVWENFTMVARLNNIYDLSEKKYNNMMEVYFKYTFSY